MTLVAPDDDPESWDTVTVGGRRWPGQARVSDCKRSWDWEKKKGKGSDGATTSLQGGDLAEPKITFKLWKGWDGLTRCDYFAAWDQYKGVFETTVADKNQVALTVLHPQFVHNKIRGVVMKEMGDIVVASDGSATVTVALIEFRKPTPRSGSPKSAGTGPGGGHFFGTPIPGGYPWDQIRALRIENEALFRENAYGPGGPQYFLKKK